jgi:D-psicose/D-tagatose/L-ribulose 3-epimerase
MRLAVSNIAWDPAEDAAVAALLRRYGIDAVDLAPGKYFPQPAAAQDAEIDAVRSRWADAGITVTGMQALLFGTTGLNLFGPPAVQQAMLDHLRAVCRIAAGLTASGELARLTFGSPKNRDRAGLDDAAADAVAVPFFRRLGDIAQAAGVIVCLEPNPQRYGANFMLTHAEAARVVAAVSHDAIRLQLDTGALTIQRESASDVLAAHAALVGHVHLSEPDLLPLGDGGTDHAAAAAALRAALPAQVLSIEMLATRDEPHLSAIERALRVAQAHYAGAAEGSETVR